MDLRQQIFNVFLNVFSSDSYQLQHEAQILGIEGSATYKVILLVSPPRSTADVTEGNVRNNLKVDTTGQERNSPTLS